MKRRVAATLTAAVCLAVGGCSLPAGNTTTTPLPLARTTAPVAARMPPSAGSSSPSAARPENERPPERVVPPAVSARAGVDAKDPEAVAAAFAEVYLSYRWDQDPAWWRDQLGRFANASWVRNLAAMPSGRESAGWRRFVAGRGTVTARVEHAGVVPAAPGGPDTVFVQISAWQVTERDGEVNREDAAPMNVELRREVDGAWRVARAWSI